MSTGWPKKLIIIHEKILYRNVLIQNPFISNILPIPTWDGRLGMDYALKVIDFGTMEKSMREEVRTSLGPGERLSHNFSKEVRR
jgi:hypothetical protein